MSGVLIAVLLLAGVFVLASVLLSRTTREVSSAPDDEYLELEGNWIRYRVAGEGPPVVLVHGWLSSGRIWERLAERLAQRFTVYALDLSGFGESDKPIAGYGVRYGSRLLYAFCAHFGLTRATVVGHDIGGIMATKLAADHSEMVSRLVLVATPANENQIDLPTLLWLSTLPVVGPIFYTLGRLLRPLRRLWMRPFVLDPEDLTEEVVDDAGKPTPAAAAKTFRVVRREISHGRLVRQAGIIKVPALVIAGEEDQIVDPQATGDWTRTISAELVLIEGCGHLPMLERTDEFNAQVLAFLTGDPRYLDSIPEPAGEMIREDAVAEMPEEPSTFNRAEPDAPESDLPTSDPPEPGAVDPDVPPTVIRKRDGRYPARNRDTEAADRGRHNASGPIDGRDPDRSADDTSDDDAEERPRRDRDGSGGRSGPLPEIPRDLFEWPESLKEVRSWDHSREADRQAREERGDEDAAPEDPKEEEEPRS